MTMKKLFQWKKMILMTIGKTDIENDEKIDIPHDLAEKYIKLNQILR